MIVEQRTYTLTPGGAPKYIALYEKEGLAIQKRILGHLFGYFHTEIGTLNQVIHMWAYDSMEERTKRRKALAADEGWQAYVVKNRPLVVTQENKILIPASFSPPLASDG